ncbi:MULTISPECIES: MATE family efflux transporter [unclassified Gilliamella]|uniref:MATE family efflux transporter n=1 Tax=unclassified Gilliamella TaxID=2685620 RepID=UPI00226A8B3D|nr:MULTISPECIES: MATE family efflux transporter [unclassified Gilliamella]MCX8596401.1 MATE family efflux transporter [Gilliamella sp. B3493]MCX8599199.1 MATE family efflux transporter [Gilliamella sp. B3486]MCX8659829.1 MATE family efflux transporter [Gilliamella sp. B2772]MCX8675649.1 MATE family efflux transporter [Gilliamella sp. B3023]MCX8689485.1 MATE family efflux transporter [Gilliamella sp. B2973]
MSSTSNLQYQFKDYIKLVIPFILSTITTPLLGVVDTALVGHLPNPAFIAGIAIGTVIFNTIYWLFGFLRVSTTGFAAQALDNCLLLRSSLIRPLFIAIFLGLAFIIFQKLIFVASMHIIKPNQDVQHYADIYFSILIWGAPFVLINYVLVGWLMGISKIKAVLFLQVFINLLNILMAVIFVWWFHWDIKGVALATLVAQICCTLVGIWFTCRYLPKSEQKVDLRSILSWQSLKGVILVNTNLMIRTICLLIVTNHFISIGSTFNTEVLAANAILFQVHYMMAYLFDGFANASSVFSGRAKGNKNIHLYNQTLRWSLQACIICPIILIAIWLTFDTTIIKLLTNQTNIITLSLQYQYWLIIFPIVASGGLIYYGVFSGISYTTSIRDSMLLALLVWFVAQYIAVPIWGNQGLWLAYNLFSFGRSIFLIIWIKKSRAYI